MKLYCLVLVLGLLVLSGCTGIILPERTSVPPVFPSPTNAQVTTSPTLGIPQGEETPVGSMTLHIWLPPQFDPASDTTAGKLLKAHLEEFSARREGVNIEVRVKAVDGPGSLLDTLVSASAAAPRALPDLIALPRPMLETAALKGLLHSLDGLTTALDDPDWYEYARQLSQMQSSTFGMPFAGDALVLAYHPSLVSTPPLDWGSVTRLNIPLAFFAADPQSLFTLALYQAAGGPIQDDQGRAFLDSATLADLLTFYQQVGEAGLFPDWLAQVQSEDQVWQNYQERRVGMVATWASIYMSQVVMDTAIAPIPTRGGTPFTYATGWVWALASPQSERQEISVQLAEFLTESSFLAEWSKAAGYLPTRPSAIGALAGNSLQSLVDQILRSARLYPSTDVLTGLGQAVQRAALQVLKRQLDPKSAAKAASEALIGP